MRYLFLVISVIVLLILFSSCSEEDKLLTISENATLEGMVSFEDGSSDTLSAEVTLVRFDGEILQTYTDTAGYFRFDSMPQGEYSVSILLRGYTNPEIEVTLLNNVIWTLDDVFLQKMASSLEGYVSFENASTDTLSALVSVSRNNEVYETTYTDSNGYYFLDSLMYNQNKVSITKRSYENQTFLIELTNYIVTTAESVFMPYLPVMEKDTKIIDGEIDGGWLAVYSSDHVSSWGPNDFEKLYLAFDDDSLYIAVSGTFSTADNTVTIAIDIDNSGDTGINDFILVEGGDIGNRIRKDITAPNSFGADIAINSGWGLSGGEGVVSLADITAVNEAVFENVAMSMNESVLEFGISLNDIYGESGTSDAISLVAYIGGGGDEYFANDVIPQGDGDFTGEFLDVFTIQYDIRRQNEK